jgi:hypothetical protein
MTTTIQCATLFDITETGVRNHTANARLPFRDQAGQDIDTETSWVRSRNQQRNWETLNQIMALRTLPENISSPVRQQSDQGMLWQFEFDIPDLSAVSQGDAALSLLLQDCEAVPMITGLTETADLEPALHTQESAANIWFEIKA